MIDRTLINLASLLVGGAGLFTVLTGFHAPEMNATFWGENPFAVKRDAIEEVTNWTFTFVAVAGLGLQVWAEIWENSLPDRLHPMRFYAKTLAIGIVGVVLLVWLFLILSDRVAKAIWWPEVVRLQSELFDRALYVVEHDGLEQEQIATKHSLSRAEVERLRMANLEETAKRLSQVEKLLELPSSGDLRERVARLRPHFAK